MDRPSNKNPKSNRAQFGLRTFFIVVTVAAILMGVFGVRYFHQYRLERAETAIRDLGGTALKDSQGHVVRVYFTGDKITDAELNRIGHHLRVLSHLQELDLVRVPVTDWSIPLVENLAQLEEVYLFETKLTDEAIEGLRRDRPKLKVLLVEPDPVATQLASRNIYPHAISDVAWSPNGRRLVTASGDGGLRIWNPADGVEPKRTIAAHDDWAFSVAFSSDGTQLASGGGDNAVRIWNTETWELAGELQGHTDDVHSVCFSADGHTLYSAGDDMTIRVWDIETLTPRNALEGHQAQIPNIAISPDGTVLASASRDQTVRLWDAISGEPLATLEGHANDVMAVAFDKYGQALVSADYDGRLIFWDVNARQETNRLQVHDGRAFCVTWDSERQRVFSGGEDGLRRSSTTCRARASDPTVFVSRIRICPLNSQCLAVTTADGGLRLVHADSFTTLLRCKAIYGERGIFH